MKIGLLAKTVGCTVETVRFYEKKGLLPKPMRSAGNFRIYDKDHLVRLSFICYCRGLDISLDEIRILLELDKSTEQQKQEMKLLLDRHIKKIATRIHELEHLRIELMNLQNKCLNVQDNTNFMSSLFQYKDMHLIRLK
ncbi:MerR family transcriptional regulator [Otariodibacter sp.]|uniref:MerR family transcriptional regulator n=1 Tax=Otariodibacter sp. TaxID=3030919 RepID=UPI00261EB0E9|nr:MerR family transcriptional regulator [Otariodibacter sp.]